MSEGRDAAAVRDDVRSWLEENWDPERPLLEWRGLLADSGWGCPIWPEEWYGRGLRPSLAGEVTAEFRAAGAVGTGVGAGVSLAANTILAHSSDQLKATYLRPIVTGEHKWCQLFSEPGSGSDLAGLTTSAVRDGDEWVVNGQKVWNTGAQKAHYGMLLARTDWDVPKHRGITFFVVDMHQPGIEVRPLRQMNGHASFNEVFLTDARVRHDHVVGAGQRRLGSGHDHADARAGHGGRYRAAAGRREAGTGAHRTNPPRGGGRGGGLPGDVQVVPPARRPRGPARRPGPRPTTGPTTRSPVRRSPRCSASSSRRAGPLDGPERPGRRDASPAPKDHWASCPPA